MALPRPGRRRGTLCLMPLVLSLLLIFSTTASAASAVLGIDIGTNFIKAAIVKPGTPLDIVLTKDSKRKEASVVAFKPLSKGPAELGAFPERLYGSDALALGGRFPGDVYTHLKPLLGLQPSDEMTVKYYQFQNPAVNVRSQADKAIIEFQSGAFSEKEQPWSVEELLAMELKNIRENAQAMAGKGSTITDAVISIPPFYTADERRAIERAAKLAGIDLMALVSDGLAVGIDYAVKREFPNVSKGGKPEIHMILDMGAASSTATILRFQSREVKDVGRFNKTVQEVAVLGSGWDRALGGNSLNSVIADHLVKTFMKKSEVSSAGISERDVRGHGRTASKIWREAERARQVLSANSDVRSSFEGFYNDIDLTAKLSRTEFEELAAPFADRVEIPFKQALAAAKLSTSDLDSVILHGGVIRTPFVQKRLEKLVGKWAEIRSNVNADESAAFGAAFKAAGLSPSFRVKEIRNSEAAIYAAGITHRQDGKQKQQKIFVPASQAGLAKQLTFKDKDDFAFTVYQHVDEEDRPVTGIQTKNLTASVAALQDKYGCSKDDIATKFTMRLSPFDGLPEVMSGSVSCEVEGSGKTGSIGDSVKGLFGFGSKKGEQEPLAEADSAAPTETESLDTSGSSTSGSSSGATASPSTAAKDAKPKKRTEVINIDFVATPAGLPQPSRAEEDRMKERLAAFDRSDKARMQREEALNVLESFTYRTRDLLTDVGFGEASTEAARSQLSSLLSSTGEWLYGEGPTATTEILQQKLADLKALVDPVQKRREEAAARPEQIKLLEGALNQTKSLIGVVTDQLAKAEVDASSAAAAAASSVSSAAQSSTTSTSDDFADLEDAETTSSTTSAKPSPSIAFSPYSAEDLESLSASYESTLAWLKEKLATQDKLQANEDAAISVKDISAKASELNRVTMNLLQKKLKMPKPSSSKKSKTNKTKKSKSGTSIDSASTQQSEENPSNTPSSVDSETTAGPSESSDYEANKAKFFTVRGDEEMPSEEDILRMVRNKKQNEAKKKTKSSSKSASSKPHEEL